MVWLLQEHDVFEVRYNTKEFVASLAGEERGGGGEGEGRAGCFFECGRSLVIAVTVFWSPPMISYPLSHSRPHRRVYVATPVLWMGMLVP